MFFPVGERADTFVLRGIIPVGKDFPKDHISPLYVMGLDRCGKGGINKAVLALYVR